MAKIKEMLQQVTRLEEQKGYDPVMQLIGYLLSEDPSYITVNGNARGLIRKYARDDIMVALLSSFLGR
ncbi:MAG: IreB family regulatory phosphoprotein [Lachnospiraceae bacterium]|nr:IreB family regulatory phosphoprotein [Lachnospiraceae bacterium]